MKKIVSLGLAAAMAASVLTGCGGEVRRQQIQRQMLRPRKQREAKLFLIRQRELPRQKA